MRRPSCPGRARWDYGWTVIAIAFLTAAVTLGTHAAFGVLLVALVDALSWGRSVVAGAISLTAVLSSLSAAPLGRCSTAGRRASSRAAPCWRRWAWRCPAGASAPWQLYVSMYVYAVLFALGFASRQGVMTTLAAALLHGPAFGTLMGILAAHIALGSALGPYLGGWIFDHAGSYEPAFWLTLVSAAVSVVCVWLAAPRHGKLPLPAHAEDERIAWDSQMARNER